MIANHGLQKIRTGEATPSEARATLRELLAAGGADAIPGVYTALRGWTWKALQLRRFDDELGEWFKVMKAAATVASDRDAASAYYIEALSHLVEESVRYAASHDREQLLRRSHVAEILETIQRHNGRLEREKLEAAMKLSTSRLSQLLTELRIAGLIDREADGRQATFVLSDFGRDQLETWKRSQKSELHPEPEAQKTVFKPFGVAEGEAKAEQLVRRRDVVAQPAQEDFEPLCWFVQSPKRHVEMDPLPKEMSVTTVSVGDTPEELRFEPLPHARIKEIDHA